MSNFADCMRERYGYEVIEHEYGFITYKLEGDICRAFEIFVPVEMRGGDAWRELWQELINICVLSRVKSVLGFVDLTKADPTTRLRAYLRNGATVKGAVNNIITIEWSVPDGA